MSDLEFAVIELCENISVLPFIIGVGSVVVLTVVARCLWGKFSSTKSGKLVALAEPNTSYPVPLIEFKLPSFEHVIGLQIGGLHLLPENGDDFVIRAHSPVPSDEGKEYVDLVLQVKRNGLGGFGGFNRNKSPTNEAFNTNGEGMKNDTEVTSSLISNFLTAIRGIGIFGMPPSSTEKTNKEITSMSISRTDSTVEDSTLETQSVSIPEDSNVKSNVQISSTIPSVSTTSPIQNQTSITITALKRPVSSSSTTVQNSAPIAAQSNSTKTESIYDKETEIAKARKRFYSKVTDLNESVSSWIVKQVKNIPQCSLLSIFKEYENYLKGIQEEYKVTKQKIDVLAKSESFEDQETCGYEDVRSSTNGNTNSGTAQPSPYTPPTKRISLATPCGSNTNSSITTDAAASSTSQNSSYEIKATSETSTSSAFASTNTNLSSPPRGYSFGITSTIMSSPIKSYNNPANTDSPGIRLVAEITRPIPNQISSSPTNSLSAIEAVPFLEAKDDEEDAPPDDVLMKTTPKVVSTPTVDENCVSDIIYINGNFVDTLYVDNEIEPSIIEFDTSIGCAGATDGQK